jgi:hypothetical protein
MCRKFGAALYRRTRASAVALSIFLGITKNALFAARYLLIKLAIFCQRQWSDRLYGVVRLLHQ